MTVCCELKAECCRVDYGSPSHHGLIGLFHLGTRGGLQGSILANQPQSFIERRVPIAICIPLPVVSGIQSERWTVRCSLYLGDVKCKLEFLETDEGDPIGSTKIPNQPLLIITKQLQDWMQLRRTKYIKGANNMSRYPNAVIFTSTSRWLEKKESIGCGVWFEARGMFRMEVSTFVPKPPLRQAL